MDSTSGSAEAVPVKNDKGLATLSVLFRLAVVVIAAFMVLVVVLVLGRTVIYKVHPYERGLHLRGGRFLAVDEPGWHLQIPLWDTVILVKVNERLGYIDQIRAVTSDDLTMVVSLEYTYRVTDPERFALEVDNPERILFELVQGKLRDVVNSKQMAEVMHGRSELNDRLLVDLQAKEAQYGVQFVTVQVQSASPPENVVNAIESRMVAAQRRDQADAEAEQTRIQADAQYYAAQKEADAAAYQLKTLAEAEQAAAESLLEVLTSHPELAEKYLDYMMTLSLQENSKWVFGASGTPMIDLGEVSPVPEATPESSTAQ
jgi:regulator of protease activity HflC (stomatin/prohibitin superfamily)